MAKFEYNPAFQANRFKRVFTLALNVEMRDLLSEHFCEDAPAAVKAFKDVLQQEMKSLDSINYGGEWNEDLPGFHAVQYGPALVVCLNPDFADVLLEDLSRHDELPPPVYAFRQKLGQRFDTLPQNAAA